MENYIYTKIIQQKGMLIFSDFFAASSVKFLTGKWKVWGV